MYFDQSAARCSQGLSYSFSVKTSEKGSSMQKKVDIDNRNGQMRFVRLRGRQADVVAKGGPGELNKEGAPVEEAPEVTSKLLAKLTCHLAIRCSNLASGRRRGRRPGEVRLLRLFRPFRIERTRVPRLAPCIRRTVYQGRGHRRIIDISVAVIAIAIADQLNGIPG